MDSQHADAVLPRRVSPFGDPRINAYVQLPVAFRSLSRPSSAPDAKASPLRSFQLDLLTSSRFENYADSFGILLDRSFYPKSFNSLCCLASTLFFPLFSFQGARQRVYPLN